MGEAAQRVYEAVEHLPRAHKGSSSRVVLNHYAMLIKTACGVPVYGCAPGSRNKRLIPAERLKQLYFLKDNDVSELRKLGNKSPDPDFRDVSIAAADLPSAIDFLTREFSK
ncbi:MAG: hypothetical protein NVS9B10_30160 [Nevskia sp.]